jgi:predicted transcriptional regulator
MAKSKLPRLSPSETEILQLLWQMGEATVQQTCSQLPPQRKIAYATVQTLLRRLESKGYITHRTEGKAHVFCPVAKREDVIKRSVSDFVNRLFGGDPIPLMHYLAEHGKVSAEDIEELRRLVEK